MTESVDRLAIEDQNLRQRLWDNLQRDPQGFRPNLEFGVYCATRRRFVHLAEKPLLKAISFGVAGPATETALLHLGNVYIAQGKFDLADRSLAILIQMNSRFAHAHDRRGMAALLAGDLDAASRHHAAAEALRAAQARETAARLNEAETRPLAPVELVIDNFGDMAVSVDLVVKAQAAGWLGDFRPVLLAIKDKVCNRALLDHVAQALTVIRDPAEARAWEERWRGAEIDLQYAPGADGRWLFRDLTYRQVRAWWLAEGRPPVFRLSEKEKEQGRIFLADLGMPKDAWFATLHARTLMASDEGQILSPVKYRNAEIADYIPAIRAITERGGWVVRIGNPTMPPLPRMEHVIDYACTVEHQDWIDVFLLGACRFFIGVASGPVDVALAFDTPTIGTNWFPPASWPVGKDTIFLPKLLRRADGSLLSFAEMCAPPLGSNVHATLYETQGLEVVDNAPEDIAAAAVEMMDWLDGKITETPEEATRQKAFAKATDIYRLNVPWRVARDFLRKHEKLLEGA